MSNLKQAIETEQDEDENEDEERSATFVQSSSIYEIQKVLCSSQYSIGKIVQDYLVSFAQQYKNLKESSDMLPGPLESVQDLVNDLVRTFNMDFNLGKDQTKDIMPHSRAAIEKYIYNKLNDHLLAIYAFKNKE